jgi:hypothetical protein
MEDPIRWMWNSPTWPKSRYDQDPLIEPLGTTRLSIVRSAGMAMPPIG